MISVALLRGINVGGRHRVAMADLVHWLDAAGLSRVQTYIQSGNIVVSHHPDVDVARVIHAAIERHSGWDVPVITRRGAEMTVVVTDNPFGDVEPTHLHVSFLPEAPDEVALAAASTASWSPEEFAVRGRDVYLHLPHGMGRSVMAPRLALIAGATTRNWNTVLALASLVDARGDDLTRG